MLINNNQKTFMEQVLWENVTSEHNIIKDLSDNKPAQRYHEENIQILLDVAEVIDSNMYFYMSKKYNDLKRGE